MTTPPTPRYIPSGERVLKGIRRCRVLQIQAFKAKYREALSLTTDQATIDLLLEEGLKSMERRLRRTIAA
jgi:hypothetical protein